MLKWSILSLCAVLFPLSGFGRETAAGTEPEPSPRDSVRQAYMDELDFIIDCIENRYVSGRRGIGDEEWQQGVESVHSGAAIYLCDYPAVWWLWRDYSMLLDDGHFAFPDNGSFSRYELFAESQPIFPLWVQIWVDGSIYNVYDYSGVIPECSEIIAITKFYNGQRAQTFSGKGLGIGCMRLTPGEPAYAFANGNSYHQPNPRDWASFTNFLSDFSMPPWEVVYKVPGAEQPDTVMLDGIRRDELFKLYKKTGNKRRAKEELGFARKPIIYADMGDGVGVLTINSFWGKRWSHMLLFGKDWRYKRLLRQAMRRIDRDGIDRLVIDVSLNTGGMAENVFYTLDYLTDKPVDITYTYLITDECRETAKNNVDRSPYLSEADREYMMHYIDSVPDGTRFRTDTVRRMRYLPQRPKHAYDGEVYVLTSHQTYSAAQMFARYCQVLGIGKVAGQHCGGYNAVTGNAARVELPVSRWMQFQVPFREEVISPDDEPYAYPTVDIPIEHPFEEWLHRENRSLERLLRMIEE